MNDRKRENVRDAIFVLRAQLEHLDEAAAHLSNEHVINEVVDSLTAVENFKKVLTGSLR